MDSDVRPSHAKKDIQSVWFCMFGFACFASGFAMVLQCQGHATPQPRVERACAAIGSDTLGSQAGRTTTLNGSDNSHRLWHSFRVRDFGPSIPGAPLTRRPGAVELHALGMPSRMNTTLRAHEMGSVATKTCHRPTEIDCAIDSDRNSRAAWGVVPAARCMQRMVWLKALFNWPGEMA